MFNERKDNFAVRTEPISGSTCEDLVQLLTCRVLASILAFCEQSLSQYSRLLEVFPEFVLLLVFILFLWLLLFLVIILFLVFVLFLCLFRLLCSLIFLGSYQKLYEASVACSCVDFFSRSSLGISYQELELEIPVD